MCGFVSIVIFHVYTYVHACINPLWVSTNNEVASWFTVEALEPLSTS